MNIKEGYMPFKDNETYYRIVNPEGKKTPLVMLHGGPGSTHNYFEVLDFIAERDDRPLVMYDQIGCGNSFVEGDVDLFNADVWMEELMALRKHLGLDEIHLLGQSWGGILQIYYHVNEQPAGIKSHILSSTLSSAKLWREESLRRISYMPEEMQKAIKQAEETGNYEDPAYLEAVDVFMEKYCDGPYDENTPEPLTRETVSGEQSYLIGWGENEFTPTGTLSDFEYTDRLHEIEVPCLVASGTMDLSSPYISKTIFDHLPQAEWELFQYSRHMPFVDETDKYADVIIDWMNRHD